ncbi:MAG: DUF3299 domain-containing protein [Deltaproteobacteria bacterium]|jgi:hypothetical protein|nr:DUF3299 domain-containing protein [Deltaproteobacteria bacterium]
MKYRHICLIAFMVALLPLGAGRASLDPYPEEQGKIVEKSDQASPGIADDGRYTEMNWAKLLPPNWNPGEVFEGLNLNMLQDNDPQTEQVMKKLMTMWKEAPTNPALQGKIIKISGFVATLDFTGKAELKEFLLVPYFGACIHVPPPPANQIIHVTLAKPHTGVRSMDQVTVYGELAVTRKDSDLGSSGYGMRADAIEPYVEKKKK